MQIAIFEIASTLDLKASLKEKLKQAMKEALNHWLITDEDEQFHCAVSAVLLTVSKEEKTRIVNEMKFLQALSSSAKGIPVNWGILVTELQRQKPIGLMALWQQVKKGER